jgi:hypothetical protein
LVEHYGRLLCMSWRAGVRIMIFFIDSRCGRRSLLHDCPINSINYPQRIARHPFAERGRFSAFQNPMAKHNILTADIVECRGARVIGGEINALQGLAPSIPQSAADIALHGALIMAGRFLHGVTTCENESGYAAARGDGQTGRAPEPLANPTPQQG